MAEPVRARRLTDQEGRRLLQIVRRGKHGSVRDVIHAFNAKGLAALDPRRAGGRPRLISDGDIEVIVTAARTRPEKPVQPFTRWSLRKLAGYLAGLGRPVRIGREGLRQLLHERGISFQRTGPGRNPPIRTGTPSWTGSST
jgi:transposase